MAFYENTIVAKQDLAEKDLKNIKDKYNEIINKNSGKVLKIGGLKEKLIAAKRSGITNIIVPHENMGDIEEIESNILKDLNIISVKNITEVLKEALV